MSESNGKFWKEKFFYLVLLLLIGSFGWTTAIWCFNNNSLCAHAAEQKRDFESVVKKDELKDVLGKLDKVLDIQGKQGERLARIEQKVYSR